MCRLFGFVSHKPVAVAHLLENTHPFTYNRMAFAHNGAVVPNQKLEEFIAPHLQCEIAGMTDSERYFLALLSEIEKAPPIEAFQTHLHTMHEQMLL